MLEPALRFLEAKDSHVKWSWNEYALAKEND
jgi:hypothetical protein